MGRLLQDVTIEGKNKKAIFDTGSVVSYITKDALPDCAVCIDVHPIEARLAGKTHRLTKRCFIPSKINGQKFEFDAFIIDTLGKIQEKGNIELDILIGAATMEEWAINLNPKDQTIDLSGLKRREFLSF